MCKRRPNDVIVLQLIHLTSEQLNFPSKEQLAIYNRCNYLPGNYLWEYGGEFQHHMVIDYLQLKNSSFMQ